MNNNVLPFQPRPAKGTSVGILLMLCTAGYFLWEMFR